jgi:adenosylcobinamide-phosphate synthase
MKRSILLPAAYIIDQIAGDPEWFPHPVRLIGSAISRGEAALRRPNQTAAIELSYGALFTAFIVGASYWTTLVILRSTRRYSGLLGDFAELSLAWTCLAARNLEQEATAVTGAVDHGDLILARKRLSRIVGRDTANLDENEISRAVIETVAESTSDGVIAPLFYMAVGGVPLAMAYKAVNTLDSMIGHADRNYFYFGKAAARLDDAANYLPSRISALAIIAATQFIKQSNSEAAWYTWRRDAANHKSPNAGQPESAIAGALEVSLGGENTYSGEVISAQRIGQEFPHPTNEKAIQSIHIASVAALIGVAVGALLGTFAQSRKRS